MGFRVDPLVDQAEGLVELATSSPTVAEWYRAMQELETRALIAAIAGLGTVQTLGPHFIAYREAARAMVEQRLTDEMLGRMEKLERAGFFVGVVGLMLAAIQVAIALWGRS